METTWELEELCNSSGLILLRKLRSKNEKPGLANNVSSFRESRLKLIVMEKGWDFEISKNQTIFLIIWET